MMEFRVYDPELNLLGITENQRSIMWVRRYFKVGQFEIHLPLTKDNVRLYQLGNIVSYRGANEAGVIEDVTMSQSSVQRELIAKGRFLSSYMDRRLIRPTINFNGYVEVAMRKLLTDAVAIPLVELGELQGYTDTIEFQATYKNLLDYEQKLSLAANIGFRFRPDFTAKKIYFETYRGIDRSRSQTDRGFVEFSDKFDNLDTVTYKANDQLLKNVGYVGGEGEGSARTYITIGDDTLTGLERREVFIDARDISSDDITQAQYLANLRERGYQRLAEYVYADSFDCETVPTGNYEYHTDYDLGDIVTVRKTDWDISVDLRITEITEVYEYGNVKIAPTLGTTLPATIDWEDK